MSEKKMCERCDDLIEALQCIVQWADAYLTDIFHEPSAEENDRAHKLLTANGMTLDAFTASMGRHCLKGIGDIARGALAISEQTVGENDAKA
jgi:hypothetical protein